MPAVRAALGSSTRVIRPTCPKGIFISGMMEAISGWWRIVEMNK
jgi:hypothetical protein